MNDDSRKSEATSVAELVRESALPIFKQPADLGTAAPLLVNPRSCEVESLEQFLPVPTRKRATAKVRDTDSFIDYVKLHQEPGTIVLGNLDTSGASFTAILDYHLTNADPAAAGFKPGTPGWGDHTCVLSMEHAPEWKAWAKMDGQLMGQAEFAQFLEDNRLDIQEPDAATVLEIARSIEATTGATFKSAIREQSGDRTLKFETNTTATAGADGKLTIPEKIKLKMPVFTNGPEYEVEAFFRYRPTAQGVKLFFSLIRPHKVIEVAVETARAAIESELKRTVLHGSASVGSP